MNSQNNLIQLSSSSEKYKMKKRQRNTNFVVETSRNNYLSAIENSLMQVSIKGRDGKYVIMPNGQRIVEFINCSYLGLDVYPEVISAYKNLDDQWGINFCCARSRFSIEPLRILEEKLSEWYRGRVITFPTVSSAHLSVMPLIASGILINEINPPKVRLIFDKLAHSSMQTLKPILEQEASVTTISHNSIAELRAQVIDAKQNGQMPVYVADGIYSMGGVCPVKEILAMANEFDFYLYLDDAHGTTILGERGEGAVLSQIDGPVPDRMFIDFSMSKGFGSAGGGIVVPDRKKESIIRTFGQTYAFSAPVDFSAVNASLKILDLHRDGTVNRLQKALYERVAFYDQLMGITDPFSPIRMTKVGDEQKAIKACKKLLDMGFFILVAFFPVVARNNAQLRVCISANHTFEQIKKLSEAIKTVISQI